MKFEDMPSGTFIRSTIETFYKTGSGTMWGVKISPTAIAEIDDVIDGNLNTLSTHLVNPNVVFETATEQDVRNYFREQNSELTPDAQRLFDLIKQEEDIPEELMPFIRENGSHPDRTSQALLDGNISFDSIIRDADKVAKLEAARDLLNEFLKTYQDVIPAELCADMDEFQ